MGDWLRNHEVEGNLAILTEGPSAKHPEANNRMEIIQLDEHPRARRQSRAPRSILANERPRACRQAGPRSSSPISRGCLAYYTHKPDASDPAQRVAFGTSGHRGSSLRNSFNEGHILAISQAICEYRKAKKINGPLFMGMDTHALSEAALATAVEVFAAHGVDVMIQKGLRYTPTPVISHAILTYNRGRKSGLADGVVITPSHNPPEDGGFKYNPPEGGPADTETTRIIEERANAHPGRGDREDPQAAL